jgi:DNA polymerase-3 subunit delta
VPPLSKDNLRDELKRRELRPVYVLYGAETYLRDGALRYITQQVFGPEDFRDLNESNFALSTDADLLRQAIAAAEQLPMMAERRLVKITDVKISQTGYRDTITEEHESLLKNYLTNPSPSSVVVVVADELNGNRKMAKLLKEHGSAVEFEPLDDAGLKRWAEGEFKKLGSVPQPGVTDALVARVGPDLHRLSNEIGKVTAAVLPSTEITHEIVEELVATSRELDNFAFTNHLVAGRGGKALAALTRILDDGTEPVMLVGVISYTFRRLLMAKDMMDKGVDRKQVSNTLRLRYSDQEPFLAAARRAQMQALENALRDIAQADIAIKTSLGGSTSGARMQIEMLVAKLALATAH